MLYFHLSFFLAFALDHVFDNPRPDAPSQPLLEKLGWQTIMEFIDMESAAMVYRSINSEAPDYLSTLFERLSQIPLKTFEIQRLVLHCLF